MATCFAIFFMLKNIGKELSCFVKIQLQNCTYTLVTVTIVEADQLCLKVHNEVFI